MLRDMFRQVPSPLSRDDPSGRDDPGGLAPVVAVGAEPICYARGADARGYLPPGDHHLRV